MQPDRPAGVASKPSVEGPLLPHHRRQPEPPGSRFGGDAAGMVTPVGQETPVVPKLTKDAAGKPVDTERLLHAAPGTTGYADPAQRFERYDPAAADVAARAAAAAKRDARRPELTPASAQAPWVKEDSIMEEQARQRNRSPQKQGPGLNAPGLPYDPIANTYMGAAGAVLAQADAQAAAAAARKAQLVGQRDSHGRDYNLVNNLPQQPFIPVPDLPRRGQPPSGRRSDDNNLI